MLCAKLFPWGCSVFRFSVLSYFCLLWWDFLSDLEGLYIIYTCKKVQRRYLSGCGNRLYAIFFLLDMQFWQFHFELWIFPLYFFMFCGRGLKEEAAASLLLRAPPPNTFDTCRFECSDINWTQNQSIFMWSKTICNAEFTSSTFNHIVF